MVLRPRLPSGGIDFNAAFLLVSMFLLLWWLSQS